MKPVASLFARVWPYLAIAGVAAAIVYLIGMLWDIHGRVNYNRGLSEARLEAAIQTEKDNAAAFAEIARMERRYDEQLAAANAAAEKRAAAAAHDAAGASADAERLRSALAQAKSDYSKAAEAARKEYTDTLADVFEESAGRYTEVARQADGHATDVQHLEEAWPRDAETFNQALKSSELSGKNLPQK